MIGMRLSKWNYLRVRGEYGNPHAVPGLRMELPPRARRIRATDRINYSLMGNYLRVRGEYR